MKANKLFFALLLLLALFFLSQFAAELSFLVSPKPISGTDSRKPAFDFKTFSLSSRLHTETAYTWLETGITTGSEPIIKRSMELLQLALRRNILDYQARYYLAKAYLQNSSLSNDYFDLGVTELKRAARIRGSNKRIALDCGKVFFSLWPFLEKEDKSFAANLLNSVMPVISWPEFKPLIEMWSLYVQDTSLLMGLLQRKPLFFGPAAEQLLAVAIPIDLRHEFLALYEVHTLDFVERRYNELNLRGEIGAKDARALLKQLRQLKGYYRLNTNNTFNFDKLAKLQRSLLLQIISDLLADPKTQDDAKTIQELREYIQVYITEHHELNSLDELQKILEEKNYFRNNDFPSLYLKTWISFEKGNYGDIIAEIEALRKTISFVKKEQLADYTNILLFLVDSYYSSKLMTAAESVVRELHENQPGNLDVLFRVLRVNSILGSEGTPEKMLDSDLEVIRNSRFLSINQTKTNYDVFLFNQPEIEIILDPVLLARLKPKQLVQIFADGKIAFESYIDGLPEKILIGGPFSAAESKVKIHVLVK